jgi:LysM repeat protein
MRLRSLQVFLLLVIIFSQSRPVFAQDTQPPVLPDPQAVIDAVNTLRLSYGFPPLAVHPVLMQIAQTQADGIANGMGGHWRPNNMTLGQWLLSLGYPLSGDLSMDGYRSENWITAQTAEEAIQGWLMDDPHTNTMLSPNRSDIGAGVAYSAEEEQIYVVIETALQTSSGQMQYDARAILTSIPMTQSAYNAQATQWSQDTGISQYSVPVMVSTPMPDGNVYHEVQYGQTLWSIAITYHTTVKEIQSMNNLTSTIVNVGQKLLVLKGVTPSAPTLQTGITNTPNTAVVLMTPVIRQTSTLTPQVVEQYSDDEKRKDMMGLGAIVVAAVLMGGMFTMMTRKKDV